MKIYVLLLAAAGIIHPAIAESAEIDFYTALTEKKTDVGAGIHINGNADFSAIFSQEYKDPAIPQKLYYNPYSTQRYGTLLRVNKKHFFCDLTVYAGTLRYGGSYTRLKKPFLPSSSALTEISFLQAGIKPALPSFTSSRRMDSVAIKTPVFSGAQFEDGTCCWSLQKVLPNFSIAVSGAQFIYGRKNSSAWFPKERFIKKDRYSSHDAEICFRIGDILKSCNATGIMENPFGGIEKSYLWARTQDSLRINCLTLQFSAFHAWTPLMILPTGRKSDTRQQIIINPILKLHPSGGTLKAGLSIQKNEKHKTSSPYSPFSDCIIKGESSFEKNGTKLGFLCSHSYSGKKNESSYRTRAYISFKNGRGTIKSSAAVTFNREKKIYSFSETLTTNTNPYINIKIGGSTTYKNEVCYGTKINGTASLSFTGYRTRWTGKIGLSTSF